MADDKDSVSKLKDLTFLKNQLESLQRRVESEVNSGVSQFAHFAATSITLLGNGTMKDGVEEGPQPRDPLKHPECSTWTRMLSSTHEVRKPQEQPAYTAACRANVFHPPRSSWWLFKQDAIYSPCSCHCNPTNSFIVNAMVQRTLSRRLVNLAAPQGKHRFGGTSVCLGMW
ncbi:uncharacterized protein [Oryctolagus cuniculus]|uniref:uncharacterized protein isoform X1 n=1 Tax=Oryctolagus cuniculus TaxID=9986 RepID=UPI003879185C